MARKGLPPQGSDAILLAMSQGNEMVLASGREKEDREKARANQEIRDFVNGKKK